MNIAYFDHLVDEINACNGCAELAALSAKATAQISSWEAEITAQLALLEPLLNVPTDLTSAIAWITSVINTYLGPQTKLLADEAILVAQLARVMAAVSSVSSNLGCGL